MNVLNINFEPLTKLRLIKRDKFQNGNVPHVVFANRVKTLPELKQVLHRGQNFSNVFFTKRFSLFISDFHLNIHEGRPIFSILA